MKATGKAFCEGADTPILEADTVSFGDLQGEQPRHYRLPLRRNQFVSLVVDQRGTDVVLELFHPSGASALTVDGLNGAQGPERLFFVAQEAGDHCLELRPLRPAAVGSSSASEDPQFQLTVLALRPAGEKDVARARAARAVAEGVALAKGDAEHQNRALEHFRRAAGLWEQTGEARDLALAWARSAELLIGSGEIEAGLEAYRQALAQLSPEAEEERPSLLNQLGKALRRHGRTEESRRTLEEAYDSAQAVGNDREAATALNNLALLLRHEGESWQALETYRQALTVYRQLGDTASSATVLHNLGTLYNWLGKGDEARDALTEALELQRKLGDTASEAATRTALGWVEYWAGEPRRARDTLERALELRAGDSAGEASTLGRLGVVYLDLGEVQKGRAALDRTLVLLRQVGDRRGEAPALNNLGRALLASGEAAAAMAAHESALQRYRELGDPTGMAWSLLGQAHIQRQAGDLLAARDRLEEALDLIESVRRAAGTADLRAHFLSTAREIPELLVEVLMQLHGQDPSLQWDRRALEVVDRVRARSLLDRWAPDPAAEAHPPTALPGGASLAEGASRPSLHRRLQAVHHQIRWAEHQRRELLALSVTASADGDPNPGDSALAADIEEVDVELRRLMQEEQRLELALRSVGAPGPAVAPADARPPGAVSRDTLEEIRRLLGDDDTAQLVYFLGEERSFLWLIRRRSLRSFSLPPRAEIEAGARRFLKLASRSQRPGTEAQLDLVAERLAHQLLAPLAGESGIRRLSVVADGALQALPFGLLPGTPVDSSSEPLLSRFEITYLVSPTAFGPRSAPAHPRSESSAEERPLLAVVAAPILRYREPTASADVRMGAEPDDTLPPQTHAPRQQLERSQAADTESVQRAAASEAAWKDLPELPFAHQEARAILQLAGERPTWSAVGFQVNRANLLQPGHLGRFHILHFATHALLNSQHPELSGLVLSQADRQGRPVDGFLRSYEIASLHLEADLVVLSACRTALGKEIWGEGIIGLPRSFLAAGAGQILVSAWPIDDQATALLMEHFYRALLEEGQSPARALRQAQLRLREDDRWQSPYYWGGFLLIASPRSDPAFD
ncbi:MAG: CHAT domain-containing tetratricopeptide repeat protein [Acidobacteriota bacterium]|nr:CHAT domain-containing tetratricopeptide repeat protein [Acidobacteriota bacterium]